MPLPRLADLNAGEWQEHVRFPGIYWMNLLTTEDNPLANVNVVQVPSGSMIGRHHHIQQVETIWVVSGNAVLTLDQTDIPFRSGQIIAIPIGLEHALRNENKTIVQLLTFFTPPLI